MATELAAALVVQPETRHCPRTGSLPRSGSPCCAASVTHFMQAAFEFYTSLIFLHEAQPAVNSIGGIQGLTIREVGDRGDGEYPELETDHGYLLEVPGQVHGPGDILTAR